MDDGMMERNTVPFVPSTKLGRLREGSCRSEAIRHFHFNVGLNSRISLGTWQAQFTDDLPLPSNQSTSGIDKVGRILLLALSKIALSGSPLPVQGAKLYLV